METEIVITYALITILALVLLLITILSYWRFRSRNLLIVSFVFFIFLIRGIFLSMSLFNPHIAELITSGHIWIVDVVILLLLYTTYSLKRKNP